jgi:hypothetical protein
MEQSTKPLPLKKAYTHPVLTEHGTLTQLTQGGGQASHEAGVFDGKTKP